MKPTYLCIGIQKAGTTSLINYLNYHPEIYCYPKECHFFNKDTEDLENYENLFQTDKKIIGEKTPNYINKNSFIDTLYYIYYNDVKYPQLNYIVNGINTINFNI